MQIQIPVELPSAQRMEEIYREEVRRAIAERDAWMRLDEAAEYLRWSRRTFDRKRTAYGLPVSNKDGAPIVTRADVDAMAKADMAVSGGGSSVIKFPSQQTKPEAVAA